MNIKEIQAIYKMFRITRIYKGELSALDCPIDCSIYGFCCSLTMSGALRLTREIVEILEPDETHHIFVDFEKDTIYERIK